MEKTLAQLIAEMTKRIKEMTALKNTGMRCQSEIDRLLEERDNLNTKKGLLKTSAK